MTVLELERLMEVMVMAQLYGHDLHLRTEGGSSALAILWCSRCKRGLHALPANLANATNWEEPCKAKHLT